MSITNNRTQEGGWFGMRTLTDYAAHIAIIGGITAVVATVASHYFGSGAVGGFALKIGAVFGVGAVVGVPAAIALFGVFVCVFGCK